jgi:hypothetical protein
MERYDRIDTEAYSFRRSQNLMFASTFALDTDLASLLSVQTLGRSFFSASPQN